LMEAEPIRCWALLGKWSLLDKVRRPDGRPALSIFGGITPPAIRRRRDRQS